MEYGSLQLKNGKVDTVKSKNKETDRLRKIAKNDASVSTADKRNVPVRQSSLPGMSSSRGEIEGRNEDGRKGVAERTGKDKSDGIDLTVDSPYVTATATATTSILAPGSVSATTIARSVSMSVSGSGSGQGSLSGSLRGGSNVSGDRAIKQERERALLGPNTSHLKRSRAESGCGSEGSEGDDSDGKDGRGGRGGSKNKHHSGNGYVEDGSAELERGRLRCLLELGHLDAVVDQSMGMSQRVPELEAALIPLGIEASWKLMKWDDLDGFLKRIDPPTSSSTSTTSSIPSGSPQVKLLTVLPGDEFQVSERQWIVEEVKDIDRKGLNGM